jgi:hypothetical protein
MNINCGYGQEAGIETVKYLNYCMWLAVMLTVTDCMIAYDKSHLVVMIFFDKWNYWPSNIYILKRSGYFA